MMRALAAVPLVVSTLVPAGAQAAAAQSKIDRQTVEIDYAYADCVVREQHALAAQVILANESNADIQKHHSDLIIGNCLVDAGGGGGSQMKFGGDLYRYALAGALVKKDLASRDLERVDTIPPLDQPEYGDEPETKAASGKPLPVWKQHRQAQSYAEHLSMVFLSRYGECVVRADPAGSKALLLSKPASSDETTKFRAIMPALNDCMTSGRTMTFGPLVLRGSIAINYYRLSYAPRMATPTKAVN